MLVSDIISRVRGIAGDTDVLQFTDAQLMQWINDGMREIASDNQLLQKSATQTVTPGTNKYPIPTDILKFHSAIYDGNDLRFVDLETAKTEGFLTNSSGTPTTTWVWAGNLVLWPTPDAAKSLELIYTRNPAEVTAVGDVPEVPSSYHIRLVDYCLAQVAQQDDDMQRYAMKMEEFRTGVQNLKDMPEYENNMYPYMATSPVDYGYDWGYYE